MNAVGLRQRNRTPPHGHRRTLPTGGHWIGLKPESGRALYVSAEDEIEELHRRLARIVPKLDTLGNLTIVPLAGKDAVLSAPSGRDGLLKPTPIFAALRHIVEKSRPALLVLDTLADLFGGDEIKKVHRRSVYRDELSLLAPPFWKELAVSTRSPTRNRSAAARADTAWLGCIR
jgi:hypothetical protein